MESSDQHLSDDMVFQGADTPWGHAVDQDSHPLSYEAAPDDAVQCSNKSSQLIKKSESHDGDDVSEVPSGYLSSSDSESAHDDIVQQQLTISAVPAHRRKSVYQGYNPTGLPDKKMLKALAELAIEQWDEAKLNKTHKEPRYEIYGIEGLSIKVMAKMRFKTHIKNRGYSPLQEMALQAASLTCRNRRSLSKARNGSKKTAAKKSKSSAAKRGRPCKVKAKTQVATTTTPRSHRCGKKVFVAC